MSSKIRKAVIREDLLSITSDFREAIILNQFIYWSERVSDADVLIEKENEIAKNNGEEEKEPFYGWIYKTADELSEEIMLGLSASQVRRYINKLVECEYIAKRNNPKYKWDRTLQYKVNLVNIARALKKNGYPLSDYKISLPDDEKCNTHTRAMENEPMQNQERVSERAIPKITTENTDRDYHSGITKADTLSFDNGKVETHIPGNCADKEPRKKSKSELLKLEVDMQKRFADIVADQGISKQVEKTLVNGFARYLIRYTEKTGKVHPILTNGTLNKIIQTFISLEELDYNRSLDLSIVDDIGESYLDKLIDEYFNINHKLHVDWHISGFANKEYLEKFAQHIVEY